MAASIIFTWLSIFYLISLPNFTLAQEFNDYELYDLVEEVNTNFYDLLEVNQTSSASDIRRAYRKLSLQLHPDKNTAADAEIKFRNLVAVYEVLKDSERRKHYDEVLVHGLPDWRHASFYYRRVRKMGLAEILLILTAILTVGHFIVSWAAYYEKRFVKEEVYRSLRKKKEKKSKRSGKSDEDEVDKALEAELELIEKPRLVNLLPCLLCRLLFHAVVATPSAIYALVVHIRESRKKVETSDDEESGDELTVERKPRRKRVPEELPTAYESYQSETVDTTEVPTSENSLRENGSTEWTEEDMTALLKYVKKFPVGTTNRWEKIATALGRSTREVIEAAKDIKSMSVRSVKPSIQGITADRLPDAACVESDVTTREEIEGVEWQTNSKTVSQSTNNKPNNKTESPTSEESVATSKRHKKPVKTTERTLMIRDGVTKSADDNREGNSDPGKSTWTQQQQKQLEAALAAFPKGTEERWDRIAESVPGRSKVECMERYKELVQLVKERQQQKSTGTSSATDSRTNNKT